MKVDYKIATLYKLVTMSFSQMAVVLYPSVYCVSDLAHEMSSSDPEWGIVSPESNQMIKP